MYLDFFQFLDLILKQALLSAMVFVLRLFLNLHFFYKLRCLFSKLTQRCLNILYSHTDCKHSFVECPLPPHKRHLRCSLKSGRSPPILGGCRPYILLCFLGTGISGRSITPCASLCFNLGRTPLPISPNSISHHNSPALHLKFTQAAHTEDHIPAGSTH